MNGRILRWIPLVATLRDYQPATFKRDLVAGLTTAVMLIPQGMAYAMLAGLDPIVGLYASTVPLVLYALLGESRQLAVGPVAIVSLLVASGIGAAVGDDPATFALHAAALALLVGAIQLAMGVVGLGFLVKYLSHPVISGFTAAAALIIGVSQLKHVLGVSLPRTHYVHEILLEAVGRVSEISTLTVVIGGVSTAALLILKRFAPRFPRFLLVVVVATVSVWLFELDTYGVAIVGAVPEGLPTPAWPALDLDATASLLPAAMTIALVGFLESVSVAKKFARENRYDLDPNRELIGLGAANVAAALTRGYPVAGGFGRTAVNAQAGARTPVASLITGALVALTLVAFTPLFTYLPTAALAAIIMTAVVGLIDIGELRHIWRLSRSDFAMLAITFLATMALGVELGILVGVVASLLWFIASTSKPHIAVLGRLSEQQVYRNVLRYPKARREPGILALRIDGPIYFANTAFLKSAIAEFEGEMDDGLRALVIDGSAIASIDTSGADALVDLAGDLDARGVQLWFASVRGPVRDVLRQTALWTSPGSHRFVPRVHDAVEGELQRHSADSGGQETSVDDDAQRGETV